MIWRAMTEESGRVLERAQQVGDEDEAPDQRRYPHRDPKHAAVLRRDDGALIGGQILGAFELPIVGAVLTDFVPPAEADKQPAGDVLRVQAK